MVDVYKGLSQNHSGFADKLIDRLEQIDDIVFLQLKVMGWIDEHKRRVCHRVLEVFVLVDIDLKRLQLVY
jgi:hypothetical protein